jgi:DNA-binding transcriptional ArsR family regulator
VKKRSGNSKGSNKQVRTEGNAQRRTPVNQSGAQARRAKALTHPLRVEILNTLAKCGEMSPKGMADYLGENLAVVSYHMRTILDKECHLIEQTRVRPRRGALEHFYRVKPHGTIGSPDWQDGLPAVLVGEVRNEVLRSFLEVVLHAVSSVDGEMANSDDVAAWVRLRVDRSCRKQIGQILDRAFNQVITVVEERDGPVAADQGEDLIVGIATLVANGPDSGDLKGDSA